MEELQTKLHQIIDSIDNPKILANLVILVTDYNNFYSSQKRTNVED